MRKVRITADAVLAILRGVLEDEDINTTILDADVPEWQGKKISETLNVDYYTYKHRPNTTQEIIDDMLKKYGGANMLTALKRSFCVLSLGTVERLFSKDNDTLTIPVTLEYFMQTEKVKVLEYLIENANIALSGIRIPVQFGDQTRRAAIFFDNPKVSDIQTGTPFGEALVAQIEVAIILYENIAGYSDYTVSITFTDDDNNEHTSVIPLLNFSHGDTRTQRSVPLINRTEEVGNVNLSRADSFVLTFEGYYGNAFIDYLADKALQGESITASNYLENSPADNNKAYRLKIVRNNKEYNHTTIIKEHQLVVNADTGNETHTLTLVKRKIDSRYDYGTT